MSRPMVRRACARCTASSTGGCAGSTASRWPTPASTRRMPTAKRPCYARRSSPTWTPSTCARWPSSPSAPLDETERGLVEASMLSQVLPADALRLVLRPRVRRQLPEIGIFEVEYLAAVDIRYARRRAGAGRVRGQPGAARPDRGQPAAGRLGGQEIRRPRHVPAGPDPRGQHRPDAGGREVRVPQGLQVQHLRDVVDSPGDHARHRRPGAHDPHPGAHGRDDQQAVAHLAAPRAGHRPRAGRRGARRRARAGRRPRARDQEGRPGAGLARDPGRLRRRQPPGRLRARRGLAQSRRTWLPARCSRSRWTTCSTR